MVLAGQKSMASALPAEWKVRDCGGVVDEGEDDGEESVMMTEARLRRPGAMALTTSSMESAGVGAGVGVGGGGGGSAARGEARPRERARRERRRMGLLVIRIYRV